MTARARTAREIIDTLVSEYGQEVFLGEGFAGDAELCEAIESAQAAGPSVSVRWGSERRNNVETVDL